jgi:RNA polymerase sigma-70 factor (ECF subfamily)
VFREVFFSSDLLVKKQAQDCTQPVFFMDEDAFGSFYQETAPALQGYIRKTCGNAALAQDLFQETFYRFLRANLPQMAHQQMKAYLFKTATTLLVDHWRREGRERFWKRLWNPPVPHSGREAEDLSKAFAELKPAERALLWLAYVEGFDHGEIASALGLKQKSIRVLLFRSRKRFARVLSRRALTGVKI